MKKYKIVNKTRFISFIIILTLSLIYIGSNLKSFAKDRIEGSTSGYKKIIVEKGDSLWAIGSKVLPEGEDIRNIVYDLKLLNNIEDGIIKEGDIIKIPNDYY